MAVQGGARRDSEDPFTTHGQPGAPPASQQEQKPPGPPGTGQVRPPTLQGGPFAAATAPQDLHAANLNPLPPAEPIIPVWYPTENNWQVCVDRMAYCFRQIHQEFTGEWSEEMRVKEATRYEKASEVVFDETGGRMGAQYEPKLRRAKVVDIYQDWRFPGDSNSWYRGGRARDFAVLEPPARWRRLLEDYVDVPYHTSNAATGTFCPYQGRVYQGALEDFYLVAAMQAVGMKPQLIANCFVNMDFSDPKLGVFIIRLYKHGQWQYVDIDDALPYDKAYTPLCCTGEFFPTCAWASLIEKAYAKLHGSWEGLGGGGHIEEVMADLTGGCGSRFSTTDVAADRLFQYLETMQAWCVFACNINECECSKRHVPIQSHWACSIFHVKRHNGVPYVCVCMAAPIATVRHMPVCDVPSAEGYGISDGFAWLRIDDFVALFDIVYECRLVNSDLGPPQITGIPYSPGWVPGTPWFEEMWAFQGDVYTETAPSFIMEVYDTPNEITLEVSQTDVRYNDPHDEPENGRGLQAPLLLRFYQCSSEVSENGGGEIYLVHLSPWGHCRDACTGVKVLRPGKYMAMVSVPAKYVCHRMIFRTYSTRPVAMKPVTQHRSFVAVNPATPLDAIPYSLAGFQRVDAYSEKLPQMFDETEGRGRPMANPMLLSLLRKADPKSRTGWQKRFQKDGARFNQDTAGHKIVGKFGGRDAVATVEAKEMQEAACSVM